MHSRIGIGIIRLEYIDLEVEGVMQCCKTMWHYIGFRVTLYRSKLSPSVTVVFVIL